MIALKCAAAEESANVKKNTVQNIINSVEGKLDKASLSESIESENITINASDDDTVEVNNKEFGLPISRRPVQKGTGTVKDIVGSFIKGLSQPNEIASKEEARISGEYENTVFNTISFINPTDSNAFEFASSTSTTLKCSTVDDVIKSNVSDTITTVGKLLQYV